MTRTDRRTWQEALVALVGPENAAEALKFADTATYEPTLEELIELEPTEVLRARVTVYEGILTAGRRVSKAGPMPAEDKRIRALHVERLKRRVQWGEERDAILERRPEGCICAGLGGRGKRFLDPTQERFVFREYCPCQDGMRARDRDHTTRREQERVDMRARIARLAISGGVPQSMRAWTLNTFPDAGSTNESLVGRLRGWYRDGRPFLFLSGTVGTGKTGLAVGLMVEAAADGLAPLMLNVPDLLSRLRRPASDDMPDIRPALVEAAERSEFLVLDDLGAEQHTGWAAETLFRLMNARFDGGQRMVVTSNLNLSELRGRVGDRVYDRITGLADVTYLEGASLRGAREGARHA